MNMNAIAASHRLADYHIREMLDIAGEIIMNSKPRSTAHPHPYWAKYAMRFKGNDDATLLKCRSDADMNCPADLPYAIREVNGDLEWYAPISPQ